MPPTSKLKKFRRMLQNEESDLTIALNNLFASPEVFRTNHPLATVIIMDPNNDCFHPTIHPELESVLRAELQNIQYNDPDMDDPDIDKVIDHINEWSNDVPEGQAKHDVQEALAKVLNPVFNPPDNDYGVGWKWNLFSGTDQDWIDIQIKTKDYVLKKPVKIKFWNSTNRTEVNVM